MEVIFIIKINQKFVTIAILITAVLMFSIVSVTAAVASTPQAHTITEDNVVIEAKYKKASSIRVTFDANGGKVGSKKTVINNINKGNKIGKLPSTPKRTGHVFNGWFTKKKGGTKISANTRPTENITYIAQWLRVGTISFVTELPSTVNGTTKIVEKTSKKNVTHTKNIGSLPQVTKTDHIFNGWYTAKTGGKKVSSTTKMPNKNMVIYSQWSKIHTLTFDTNSGKKVVPASKKLTRNKALGSLPKPTRTDHSFLGWYTAKTGGKKVSSTTRMPNKNMVIYAQWKDERIDVKVETKKLLGQWKRHDGMTYTFYPDGKVTFIYNSAYSYTGNYEVLAKKNTRIPNDVLEIKVVNLFEHFNGNVKPLRDIVLKYKCWKEGGYENLNIDGLHAATSGSEISIDLPFHMINDCYIKVK